MNAHASSFIFPNNFLFALDAICSTASTPSDSGLSSSSFDNMFYYFIKCLRIKNKNPYHSSQYPEIKYPFCLHPREAPHHHKRQKSPNTMSSSQIIILISFHKYFDFRVQRSQKVQLPKSKTDSILVP